MVHYISTGCSVMLLKFVAPNDCGQFFTVKRALPITTVEYVRFVGCKWSFYPGVGPYFFPDPATYLPEEILGVFLWRALPLFSLPQLSTTSIRVAIRDTFPVGHSSAALPVWMGRRTGPYRLHWDFWGLHGVSF
jgi:hypothetical protein